MVASDLSAILTRGCAALANGNTEP